MAQNGMWSGSGTDNFKEISLNPNQWDCHEAFSQHSAARREQPYINIIWSDCWEILNYLSVEENWSFPVIVIWQKHELLQDGWCIVISRCSRRALYIFAAMLVSLPMSPQWDIIVGRLVTSRANRRHCWGRQLCTFWIRSTCCFLFVPGSQHMEISFSCFNPQLSRSFCGNLKINIDRRISNPSIVSTI